MTDFTVPLFSQEAEQSIVGGLLINPGDIDLLDLQPEHFYVQRNRWVYEAIRYLTEKDRPVDIVTVTDRLDQMGCLGDVGGPAYLTAQISFTPSSLHLEQYAEIVRNYAWRRSVLETANNLAKLAYQFDLDRAAFGEAVSVASGGLLENVASRDTVHISEVFKDIFQRVADAYENPVEIWGMRTGLKDLDALLGGLHTGELFDLAGKPGAGKSRLALEMAIGLASSHDGSKPNPGVIYSLELSKEAVGYRGISSLSEVETRKLKTGQMQPDDWGKFVIGNDKGEKLPIWINDKPMTIHELRADIARMKCRHNIQWFQLDYMMLIDGYNNLNDTERSKMFSRCLKGIVKQIDVHGTVINSVTKLGMDNKLPDLNDMAGSGAVLHDADIVAFVVPGEIDESLIKLIFKKVRDVSGGVDKVLEFYAHKGFPKVSNLDHRQVKRVSL